MPLFQFNDGVDDLNNQGSNVSVPFTDDGINFTLSTTGNPGFNAINYNPDDAGNDGLISITDSSGNAPFTLAINGGTASDRFGGTAGSITMTIAPAFLSGAWNVTFVDADNTANNVEFNNVAGGQVLKFGTTSSFSGVRFTPTGSGNFIMIDSLNASIVCYLEDTGIATPNGDVAVQDLRPGDMVLTADGGQTAVKWVGIQPVQTRLTHPAKVNPICLTAGSIAQNVPAQDLYVSPDHAIAIDGILYNASTLVNGRSIYMVPKMPLDGFTYYHVETEAHELILAEGCAAETYLNGGTFADNFVNAGDRAKTPMIAAMDMPRVSSRRLVPTQVIDRLSARADELAATHTPIAEVA